jgi:2'-5' RNA ligase
MTQPLILTLQLDQLTQAFYENLRRHYFPPHRNLIPAHVTLFHQLPDEPDTHRTLSELAENTALFDFTEPQARSIGRGVAVFLRAEAAIELHAALSARLDAHLIAQDRQRFQPHIVVQNKVDAETAQRTLQQLCDEVFPAPHALGLSLWRYLEGPWDHLRDFPFASQG